MCGTENCLAVIWKDGSILQSLQHSRSVCDAKFMSNSDIVTACSDWRIRVWTEKSGGNSGNSDGVGKNLEEVLSITRKLFVMETHMTNLDLQKDIGIFVTLDEEGKSCN